MPPKYPVNHELTFLGGQTFLFTRISPTEYVGSFSSGVLWVDFAEFPPRGRFYPASRGITLTQAKLYTLLGLDDPLEDILTAIEEKDNRIKAVINNLGIVLVLKQPFWETLVQFILSSANNIKRIRGIVHRLSKSLGKRVTTPHGVFFTFPEPQDILKAGEAGLRELGTGFRATYLIEAAKRFMDTTFHDKIAGALTTQDVEKAVLYLTQIPGVGPKVADCVLAFSFKVPTVTPIDRWAKRYIELLYSRKYKHYGEYSRAITQIFEEYTLWAGQYLFEAVRLRQLMEA